MSRSTNRNTKGNIRMSNIAMVLAAVALLATGIAAGAWWAGRDAGHDDPSAATANQDEREILYWYDPMMPDQRFDKPGKSPFMDMMLVPKYADEATGGGVRIDPGLRQSTGIRTAEVELGRLAPTLRVPGTLDWDLRAETVVSARAEGLITRVEVKAPYTPVRRGQPLAALLAPGWSSAQAESRALQQAESVAARELQSAARQRLRSLGIPGNATTAGGSVALVAPHDGVVSEVLVREGQTVMPGTPLFRVNGIDTLWLEASVPQADAGLLQAGSPVSATVSALPGQRFDGVIETLLPQVDAGSLTQRARIVLRNPDGVLGWGALVPGMFAEVTLQPATGDAVPLVPTEALIATGSDHRVIVQDDDGGFRPVRVRVGRSDDGRSEILAGLDGGVRVVVSGQFLIDSEASLSGLLGRLEPERAGHAEEETTAHDATSHDATPHEATPHESALHEAEATVEAIEEDRITLRHGPFRTLHMPGMTMRFRLASPDVVEGAAVGDRVRVFVRSDDEGLTVVRLEPIGARP